jgi:hypothetical protein
MKPDYSGDWGDRPLDDEPKSKIKRRAQDLAKREVGAASEWERFVEQAEGYIQWENFERWMKDQGWDFIKAYDYPNAEGKLVFQSLRYHHHLVPTKKKFILRRRGPNGAWVHGAGEARLPYQLPQLIARKGEPIVVVEGEKGADRAILAGLRATCVQGQNWTDDVTAFFAGEDVILCLDDDDAGRKNTDTALKWLAKVKAKVRVVKLPDLAPRQDLYDWLEAGHTKEQLLVLADAVPVSGRVHIRPYSFPLEKDIPLMDWLYGHHLRRGDVAGTAAAGGTGKSNLGIVEALAMVSGKTLLDHRVREPLGVLLVNMEEDRDMMNRRIVAAKKQHHLSDADIGRRLFVVAKGEIEAAFGQRFVVAQADRAGRVTRNEKLIEAVIAFMLEHKVDVLSLDPFIAAHGVNENDNMAIRQVVECFEAIAGNAGAAVHLWHHARKPNGEVATSDSARGASSFVDACRAVRVMEKMPSEEAQKLNIPDPQQYFRLFSSKRNFAPPATESEWYRIETVALDNGAVFGDDVSVVTRWTHPGTISLDPSPGAIEALKRELADGEWREDLRAAAWAGRAVAEVLKIDAEQDKDAIKALLKKLIAAGHLTVVFKKDSKRMPRGFIIPAERPSSPTGAK